MNHSRHRLLKFGLKVLPFLYGVIVLALSYGTYVRNYSYPPYLYWDENYHIASAQKYISGVYFMEPHPPLGKLLIALGEKIFDKNSELDTSAFLSTDHIKTIPKDYSFVGVRFFPVLAAWLVALLFYLSLLLISNNPHTAFLFSFLYIFDNALVLHSRGAMLDTIQLFFVMSTITYALVTGRYIQFRPLFHYGALGVLCGLALAVKANSAIVLLVFPALFLYEFRGSLRSLKVIVPALAFRAFLAFGCLLLPFLVTWWVHFALGKQVLNNRFYGASEEYKEILTKKETASLNRFGVMMRDSFLFFDKYEKGVPKLDVCKQGENGSFPLTWLLGKKSINYRWERTQDGSKVRYLILQCNPIVWSIGLVGLILALSLFLGKVFFGLTVRDKKLFFLLCVALVMYCGYMAVMLELDRTMYLYHYFIPLMLSFYLSYIVFHYGFSEELRRGDLITYASLGIVACQVLVAFHYFGPLTYYEPLAAYEVFQRAWLSVWELSPIL